LSTKLRNDLHRFFQEDLAKDLAEDPHYRGRKAELNQVC